MWRALRRSGCPESLRVHLVEEPFLELGDGRGIGPDALQHGVEGQLASQCPA
jgi:hypothetical protein